VISSTVTTGTWAIDRTNSHVGFSVRHLGVLRAHGRFNDVTGHIVTGESIEQSRVSARIGANSIDTGFPARDGYIKGADVLATSDHKAITFNSRTIRPAGGNYLVDGELAIRGTTRPITLTAHLGGFGEDPSTGHAVLGVSAAMTIKRADFGFSPQIPATVIGDDVDLAFDIYARLV
jgi:polyisoprenoid-binding protein YceI